MESLTTDLFMKVLDLTFTESSWMNTNKLLILTNHYLSKVGGCTLYGWLEIFNRTSQWLIQVKLGFPVTRDLDLAKYLLGGWVCVSINM